ncbi:MAG: hypothetical protein ACRDFC_04175 [Ignavibacteria bacterium]
MIKLGTQSKLITILLLLNFFSSCGSKKSVEQGEWLDISDSKNGDWALRVISCEVHNQKEDDKKNKILKVKFIIENNNNAQPIFFGKTEQTIEINNVKIESGTTSTNVMDEHSIDAGKTGQRTVNFELPQSFNFYDEIFWSMPVDNETYKIRLYPSK